MPGTESSRGRGPLESLWRQRVKAAKTQYDLTVSASAAAMKVFREGVLPVPDGGFNLVSALRAEREARTEYLRVLQVFTDLVVSGKQPDEK